MIDVQPENVEGVAELLRRLVDIPSVHPHFDSHGGEQAVAEFVCQWFSGEAVRATMDRFSQGRANALVTVAGTGSRHILLHAHSDTVAPTQGPIGAQRTGYWLAGLGACDDKASLAAMMVALRNLARMDPPPASTITLAAVAGEEHDQAGTHRLLAGPHPYSAAIVGEPTGLRPVLTSNGEMWCRIVVHGQSAHASTPHLGTNALYGAAEILLAIRDVLSPAYVGRRDARTGGPTISPDMIAGGRGINTVPDFCTLDFDRRLAPGEDPAVALAEIRSALAGRLASHWRFTVEAPNHVLLPLQTSPSHWLVRALCDALVSAGLDAAQVGVPYGSDASLLAEAGITSLVWGPGDIAVAHTAGEGVDLRDVAAAADLLTTILSSL